MTGIKCTKCGHVIDRTQTATQIGVKILRDVCGISSTVGIRDAGSAIDSVLAGGATEAGIKCPKCGGTNCFVAN
jgi:phage FluMu protein Com